MNECRNLIESLAYQTLDILSCIFTAPLVTFHALQCLSGIKQVASLPANTLHVNQYSTAKRITHESAMQNLIMYALPVIAYEAWCPAILQQWLDPFAHLWFLRIACQVLICNTAYNSAATSAVVVTGGTLTLLQPCGCTNDQVMHGSLYSSLYYLSNSLVIYMISQTGSISLVVTSVVLKPLMYGQCLIECRLGTAGTCSRHRTEYCSARWSYALGLGLGMQGMTKLMVHGIQHTLGISPVLRSTGSAFIHDAVSSFLFPQFIMLIQYQGITRAATTTTATMMMVSVDPFKPVRAATDCAVDSVTRTILPRIKHADQNGQLIEFLKAAWESLPTRIIRRCILTQHIQSAEGLVTSPGIHLLLTQHHQVITQTLRQLADASQNPTILRGISYFEPLIPRFIADSKTKAVINIIKRDGTYTRIQWLQYLMEISQRHQQSSSSSSPDLWRSEILHSVPVVYVTHFKVAVAVAAATNDEVGTAADMVIVEEACRDTDDWNVLRWNHFSAASADDDDDDDDDDDVGF